MSEQEDEAVWGHYAKGVKKLHGAQEDEPAKPRRAKNNKQKGVENKEEAAPIASAMASLINEGLSPSAVVPEPARIVPPKTPWKKEPLDLRVERNMSLGDVVIEAKLDLHGQTEQAAYETLLAFIEMQRARGKRMLLVITGKGPDGASVLRANLPRWCGAAPLEDTVLAVRTAAQHHGGDGAYYVLLRKKS
jgi:DNA-nicking Smr family endonuclease